MVKNDIREKILKVLSEHPEGLTFSHISREVGVHRNTVTKYLYEMKGADLIKIRDLKTLKLCYIKEKASNKVKKGKN